MPDSGVATHRAQDDIGPAANYSKRGKRHGEVLQEQTRGSGGLRRLPDIGWSGPEFCGRYRLLGPARAHPDPQDHDQQVERRCAGSAHVQSGTGRDQRDRQGTRRIGRPIQFKKGYTFKDFRTDVKASNAQPPDGLPALRRAIRKSTFFGGVAADHGKIVKGTVVLPRAGEYFIYTRRVGTQEDREVARHRTRGEASDPCVGWHVARQVRSPVGGVPRPCRTREH